MAAQFASNKRALGICDVCGFSCKLKTLRELVVKGQRNGILACRECWEKDHPQLHLGTFPIYDPQALRNPRPDHGELAAVRAIIVPLKGVTVRARTGAIGVGE